MLFQENLRVEESRKYKLQEELKACERSQQALKSQLVAANQLINNNERELIEQVTALSQAKHSAQRDKSTICRMESTITKLKKEFNEETFKSAELIAKLENIEAERQALKSQWLRLKRFLIDLLYTDGHTVGSSLCHPNIDKPQEGWTHLVEDISTIQKTVQKLWSDYKSNKQELLTANHLVERLQIQLLDSHKRISEYQNVNLAKTKEISALKENVREQEKAIESLDWRARVEFVQQGKREADQSLLDRMAGVAIQLEDCQRELDHRALVLKVVEDSLADAGFSQSVRELLHVLRDSRDRRLGSEDARERGDDHIEEQMGRKAMEGLRDAIHTAIERKGTDSGQLSTWGSLAGKKRNEWAQYNSVRPDSNGKVISNSQRKYS